MTGRFFARAFALALPVALGAMGPVTAPAMAQETAQETARETISGGTRDAPLALVAPSATMRDIVLYRTGPAAVLEARSLVPGAAVGRVYVHDLPAGIADDSLSAALMPGSANAGAGPLVPARAVGLQRSDIADGDGLLGQMIGRRIQWIVRDPVTGVESALEGRLRGVVDAPEGGRPVVERDGALEVLPAGRLRLDPMPADISLGLGAAVDIDVAPVPSTLFLRYAVDGLAWDARYDITVAPGAGTITIGADYLLRNASDHDFAGARLTLVAGDVPRVAGPQPIARPEAHAMMSARAAPADADGPPAPVARGDRQIFTIGGPITLAGNSTQRRPLIAPAEVPARRTYRLTGQGDAWPGRIESGEELLRPTVELAFDNAANGPLGRPLPAGLVSVRAAHDPAAPGLPTQLPTLLLAEARMPETPVGERVTLDLGEAFDVSARRRLDTFEWTGEADPRTNRRPYRAAHEIVLKNAKSHAVTVQVDERFTGAWRIAAASHEAERPDARTARFTLRVPAGGTETLRYEVSVDGR